METYRTPVAHPTTFISELIRKVLIPLVLVLGVYGLVRYAWGAKPEVEATIEQVSPL